jgi:hypothetical protein
MACVKVRLPEPVPFLFIFMIAKIISVCPLKVTFAPPKSPAGGLLPHPLPFSLVRRRVLEERVEVPPAGDLGSEKFR